MRQLCLFCCAAAICSATLATEAKADVFSHIWRGYKENRDWPAPYVYPDRAAVRAPFTIQINNGWRLENTIGDQYFVEGGTELNESGKLKLRWVARLAPTHRRTVFVLEADDPEVTAARIENVQTAMAKYLGPNEAPSVTTTRVPNVGSSAEYIDQVERKWRETTPNPRIPPPTRDDNAN